jgi:DNA mismatch repair protein MutS2
VIADFEKEARDLIKSVKDKKQIKKIEKSVAEARGRLTRKTEAIAGEIGPPAKKKKKFSKKREAGEQEVIESNAPIEKGSKVRLRQFGTIGRVEQIEGETAFVMVGSVRLKQKVADLQVVVEKSVKRSPAKVSAKHASGETLDTKIDNKSVSHELNLIGMTTLDAVDEVDRFLDDSYGSKIMRVRIIHGHGTGALRNAVHGFLKGHIHVENFGFAAQNEGGHGATVVELRK